MYQGMDQNMKGRVVAEYIGVHPSGIPRRYCGLTQVRGEGLPQLTKRDLKRDQEQDPLSRDSSSEQAGSRVIVEQPHQGSKDLTPGMGLVTN